jgi:hypothetical protein
MSWFRKTPASKTDVAVEVEKQKDVLKAASRQSVGANQKLTGTIAENGFTVIIAATMGAQRHIGREHSNGY